jgi:hypothetical protein
MYQIEREMGCSDEDLIRWLPQALDKLYFRTTLLIDDKVLLCGSDPLLEISGKTRPERKIALLNIPILDLSLTFSPAFSQESVDELIKRFDLYTRRGGG